MRTKPITTRSSWVAKSTTARKMFSLAASLIPTMFSPTRRGDHGRADDDVPRVVLERLPEDREVVRDEERRDGDRDHVVQELRPGGAEADELVEGVAREARGAAGLRVADGAFGVRQRGGGEDQAGDDEDERRQAEREDGGDAERVVDRRADVAVGGGEERGRTEDAVEALSAGGGWAGLSRSPSAVTDAAGQPAEGRPRSGARPGRRRRSAPRETQPFAAGAGLRPARGQIERRRSIARGRPEAARLREGRPGTASRGSRRSAG